MKNKNFSLYAVAFKDGQYAGSIITKSAIEVSLSLQKGCIYEVYELPSLRRLSFLDIGDLIAQEKEELDEIERQKANQLQTKASGQKDKPTKPSARPIRCVETGAVFPNIREAATATGLPYMTIVNRINKTTPVYELHFEDVKPEDDGGL